MEAESDGRGVAPTASPEEIVEGGGGGVMALLSYCWSGTTRAPVITIVLVSRHPLSSTSFPSTSSPHAAAAATPPRSHTDGAVEDLVVTKALTLFRRYWTAWIRAAQPW